MSQAIKCDLCAGFVEQDRYAVRTFTPTLKDLPNGLSISIEVWANHPAEGRGDLCEKCIREVIVESLKQLTEGAPWQRVEGAEDEDDL